MKKSVKAMFAASMLAALFVGCNNGGLIANDELDEADVEGYATENGVIILEWEDVKDATGYTVYVKTPYTEQYSSTVSSATLSNNGLNRYVYTGATEADAEYEFKVVATTTKQNVLDSVAEISVETPEEFTDTAIFSGSEITATKVANTVNVYDIGIPVDAGFSYTIVFTTDAVADPELLFGASSPFTSWDDATYDGASYITVTKENDDGDDYVENAVVVKSKTIPADGKAYYIYVKAAPKNSKVATTKYVRSTASYTATYEGTVTTPTSWGTTISESTGAVVGATFYADKYNYTTEVSADKYTVYRKVTKNNFKVNATTGAYITLTPTVTWETIKVTKDSSYNTDYTSSVKYTASFTEPADATDGTYSYDFDYYIIYKDINGDYNWVSAE